MNNFLLKWKASKFFEKLKGKLRYFFDNRLVKTILIMLIGLIGCLIFFYVMVNYPLVIIGLLLLACVIFIGMFIYHNLE
jgi:hypothetical protein